MSLEQFYFNFEPLLQRLRMPKRKPSQPQGDVHVEVEPRTNHGKRKKDRATMDVPQTSNLVPVEHAEGTNVLDSVSIETVGVTPTPINSIQFLWGTM